MIAQDENSLSLRIKAEAQRLGFQLVGISPVKLLPHQESFAEWLRQGFSGEMEYMKRTEEMRRDPHRLVPWAVSIISVGMNYHTPFSRPIATPDSKGWISRYAWGDDYHRIMQNKLESLLDTVRRMCNGGVEGKAFVDSGPVLEREFAGIRLRSGHSRSMRQVRSVPESVSHGGFRGTLRPGCSAVYFLSDD